MCTMRRIAFGLGAFISVAAAAAPIDAIEDERALREACSYEITGMRECLEQKQKVSALELKSSTEDARKFLAKWDEEAKYIKLSQARLAAAEQAFIKYRNAQCAYAASLAGGAIGNAHDMARLACEAELNTRRAAQLRNAVADLPLK